ESHRNFLRKLLPCVEYDDLFILHAWWAIDETTTNPPIAQRLAKDPSSRQSIIWSRYLEKEIRSNKPAWARTGYFGHTAVINYPQLISPGENLPIQGPQIVLL